MPDSTRRRTAGPPSRADDQTGSSAAFASAIAADLPDVSVEGRQFACAGHVFLELSDDVANLVLEPGAEVFRAILDRTPRDELRDLIGKAWRAVAPRRSQAALDRRLARSGSPIDLDDIEAIIAELPGVSRRVKFRGPQEVILWDAGRTMFVKFGEAGNLLAPDSNDTLLIRRCHDRPSLLASNADRFFITRHYGDPHEPGPILTRLSENGPQWLPELRELIIESWREVAPKRAVAAFDSQVERQ